ncbi:JAB domain-containing protein [Lutibacter sp.]|uniref:JAB domain-containing protein n=1 Tax=Lutibacter sp. TaxID=1925666 RepID=UPI0035625C45
MDHPSGKLIPSQTDKDLTKKMKQVAKFIYITVIDFLIVSYIKKNYSFSDEGIL